jgi:hypothetical protein
VIGLDETITFRRLLAEENATRNLYDVYFKRATFTDKFTNEVMKGGLGIWIYGRHGWEHIIDDTTGLLENYGDHIVSAVFGNETLQNLHVNSFASAMVTSKNALQLFSQMTNDGKTLAEALFALGVDVKYYYKNSSNQAIEVVRDGNGWKEAVSGNAYTGDVRDIYAVGESNAKLSADYINFNGKKITFQSNEDSTVKTEIGLNTREGVDVATGERVQIEEVGLEVSANNNRGFSMWMSKTPDGIASVLNVVAESYFAGGVTLLRPWSIRLQMPGNYYEYGASGTFTTADGKTVTVTGGIITNIAAAGT